ncbi:MAG: uncharacterized protein JWM90_624, partial [Thermoleophilia bacterium]|nr:uncharacterized protein [Thermoleophilia bacterium]
MRTRFSHTRTRSIASCVRARTRGLPLLIAVAIALVGPAATPAVGANFAADQNADMLIGGSGYGERSFDADRSTAGTVALWHFDAAIGRDADSSGNGHTLTPRNSPGNVDGPSSGFHKAAALNGSSQDFSAASSPAFNLTTNFTVEAWFRTSDIGNTANPAMVTRQDTGTLHTNYELWFDRGSNELNFSLTSGGTWYHATVGSVPYVNGAWHHVAGVYDGSFLRLYVDGALVDTTACSGAADTPAQPIMIGNDIPLGPELFHGDIDDVRISNVVRSAASIAATWTAGLPFHINFAEYGMNSPSDVAVDASGSVYVVDTKMHRLLRWGTTPTRDGEPPEHVLFKPTVGNGATPDIRWSWATTGLATSMSTPSNVALAGDGATLKVAVGDGFDNRVLLLQKNETTLANGDLGTIALGQPDMSSNAGGNFTASGLDTPMGMWTDGTRLAIADRVLHRVLLWDSWPTAHNQPADHVIGQAGYGASNVCPNRSWDGTSCNGINSGASEAAIGANTLESPHDVHFDGSFLYVADSDNNRLLVWSGWPSSDGPAADWVLGQANMTVAVNSHGSTGLYRPSSVSTTGTGPTHKLAVAGRQGSRVLIWNAWPDLAPALRSNAVSSSVLGQSAHGLGTANRGTGGTGRAAANSLNRPSGLTFDPTGSLWIVDQVNNRVVRYDSAALATGSSANRVLGHRSMTSSITLDAAGANVFPSLTLGSYTIWGARLGVAPSGKLIETNFEESAARIWNAPATDCAEDVRLGPRTR